MKKIIFLLLSVVLSITTLWAQITPTSNNTTVQIIRVATVDTDGIIVVDVAEPDSNGLSNNTYSNFSTSNNLIIFNNSAVISTTQIENRNVNANANITAGNEASLILNQVEGTTTTLLERMLEVAGTTAAVIIANPNGITCNGCGIINASRIDLIAGAIQSDGSFDNLNTIEITGSGLNAPESEVNLVADSYTISAPIQAETKLRILSGNGNYNPDGFAITSNTSGSNTYAVDISFGGNLQAESIDVVVTSSGFKTCNNVIDAVDDLNVTVIDTLEGEQDNDFLICTNATISADNFNVSVGSSFSINSGNITIADNFTAVVGEDFYSRGIIAADNFFVSTENNLDIDEDITTNSIDFQVGKDFFFRQFRDNFVWNANDNLVVEGSAFILALDFTNNGAISIANEFDIVVDNFNNNANINADILTISTNSFVNAEASRDGNINVDTLNLSVTGDFDYSANYVNNGNINANNQYFNVNDGSFINTIEINLAGNFGISADSFINTGEGITVNTFSLSATGNFNYAEDFVNAGNINANNLNFILNDGDFINSTVIILEGNLGISADNFINTGGTVTANTFTLSVATEDFDYAADYVNNGNINVINLNLQVDGNFSYNDAVDFVLNEQDSLVVFGDASVNVNDFTNNGTINIADSFNVTAAAGDFTNNAAIYADSFNVTAAAGGFTNNANATIDIVNDFSITLTGEFSDFINNATISAANFNITASGDFDNNATIDIVNDFNITVSGDFDNNATIDVDILYISANSFLNEGAITVDTLNISVVDDFNSSGISADNFIVKVGGDFSYDDVENDFILNTGNSLEVEGNIFVTADNFSNYGDINANVLNLFLAGNFYNDETLSGGNIDATFSVRVGGDLTYHDIDSNFILNSFVVLGDASVTVNNFTNRSVIDIENFNVTVAELFDNNATINVANFIVTANNFTNDLVIDIANSFNLTVAADFDNNATISAANFNLTTNNFTNDLSIDIADNFNITVSEEFNNNNNATINADNFALDVSINFFFNDGGNINVDSFNIDVETSPVDRIFDYEEDYLSNGTITATNQNFIVRNGDFTNTTEIEVTGTLGITANVFENFSTATIIADTLNILVDSFINYDASSGGTINVNTISLSVEGDFDYSSDYRNNGLITATNQYFTTRNGDFTNTTTTDIVLTGDLGITTDSFINFDNTTISANNLSIVTVVGDLINDNATIQGNSTVYIETAGSLLNDANATIEADNLSFVTLENFTNRAATIQGNNVDIEAMDFFLNTDNATIDAASLTIVTAGEFFNEDAIIDVDNLTIEADRFINTNATGDVAGNIIADTFTLSVTSGSVEGVFNYNADYLNNGNISGVNNLNFVVETEEGDGEFNNTITDIVFAGNLGISADIFINADYATIEADNLRIVAGNYFSNSTSSIKANSIYIEAGSYILNSNLATIDAENLTIVTGAFFNTNNRTIDGNIITDTFNLSVTRDFDYASDYINNGNIEATDLNLTVINADFSNNNETLNADNLNITAENFTNDGTINVATNFNVTVADNFTNNAEIDVAANFNVTATGDFINNTAIDVGNNFTVTATGDFINNAAIDVANNFNVITGLFDNNAAINAANFNVTATGDFINNTAIDVGNNFTVTATGDFINNAAIDVANNFNVITGLFDNNAAINAANFNVTATGDFTNNGEINVTNRLNVTTAIGDFTNNAAIDVDSFATRVNGTFQNEANAEISAIRTGLFVNDFNNFGDIDSTDLFYAEVSQDFSNSGNLSSNLFIVEANNFSNEINGDIRANIASIISNSFNNSSNSSIQSANLFIKTTGNGTNLNNNGDFNNSGSINSQALIIIAQNDFNNHQEIIADHIAIHAGSFYNDGTFENDFLDISADTFINGGDINTYVLGLVTNSYDNSGDVNFRYLFR